MKHGGNTGPQINLVAFHYFQHRPRLETWHKGQGCTGKQVGVHLGLLGSGMKKRQSDEDDILCIDTDFHATAQQAQMNANLLAGATLYPDAPFRAGAGVGSNETR